MSNLDNISLNNKSIEERMTEIKSKSKKDLMDNLPYRMFNTIDAINYYTLKYIAMGIAPGTIDDCYYDMFDVIRFAYEDSDIKRISEEEYKKRRKLLCRTSEETLYNVIFSDKPEERIYSLMSLLDTIYLHTEGEEVKKVKGEYEHKLSNQTVEHLKDMDKIEKALLELQQKNQILINREKELNDKLSKQAKKHDKEIRVLEHRIQELEKELYGDTEII